MVCVIAAIVKNEDPITYKARKLLQKNEDPIVINVNSHITL